MQFIETTVSPSFKHEIALPEAEISLARAGLYFAQIEYPTLDCAWYLGQLDLIATGVANRAGTSADFDSRLQAMTEYLYSDLGYSGNVDNYYDPRNSYLNEVMDRRVGIPITLSIVYLELAQRLDLDAQGIAFPGHFLVAVSDGESEMIVDAFDRGASVPRATFVERLNERVVSETSPQALESVLTVAPKSIILLRQLRNLKAIYAKQGDIEKTLSIINHMLTIDSDLLPELTERAALYDTLGHARGAVDDYRRALTHIPVGEEHEDILQRLRTAEVRAATLH